jgi:hypothetical protein
MNFIQQKLQEKENGRKFEKEKKQPGKLAKPSKNFKRTRAK